MSMELIQRPSAPALLEPRREPRTDASVSPYRTRGETLVALAAPMPESTLQRDVKASGVRLRVLEAGDGAPVVLLHGLFVDHSSWNAVIANLDGFRLVAPDLPGFGESEKPPASRFSYQVDAFSEAVADLYAGLDIGPAGVVGHGLGGAVALTLAALHPELVSRLVLVDALCYEAPVDLRRRIALMPVFGGFVFKQLWGRATFRGFFREMVASDSNGDEARVNRYYDAFNSPESRGSALATMRATADTRPLVAYTARIKMPTLVVWGGRDRMYPPPLGKRLAREIAGAGFELLDTGHAPHEERPEQFSDVVRRFLRAQRPSKR